MEEKNMEFNEQPLTYVDVVAQVTRFERQYKVRSEDFFDALDRGVSSVDVHPEDLYEWRSYFGFKTDLDARLARVLLENGEPIQEVEYSLNSGLQERVRAHSSAANNNLALAA